MTNGHRLADPTPGSSMGLFCALVRQGLLDRSGSMGPDHPLPTVVPGPVPVGGGTDVESGLRAMREWGAAAARSNDDAGAKPACMIIFTDGEPRMTRKTRRELQRLMADHPPTSVLVGGTGPEAAH